MSYISVYSLVTNYSTKTKIQEDFQSISHVLKIHSWILSLYWLAYMSNAILISHILHPIPARTTHLILLPPELPLPDEKTSCPVLLRASALRLQEY